MPLTSAGGTDIIVDQHWPREKFSHIENVKSNSHPLIFWLAKYLKFDPWSYYPKTIYRENDPILYYGKIICGPDIYKLLCEKIKVQR